MVGPSLRPLCHELIQAVMWNILIVVAEFETTLYKWDEQFELLLNGRNIYARLKAEHTPEYPIRLITVVFPAVTVRRQISQK